MAFPKIVARVWAEKQGDLDKLSRKIQSQIDDHKFLRASLLQGKWLRNLMNNEDYANVDAEYASQIAKLEQELQDTRSERITQEAFIRFSELLLMDIALAWEIAERQVGVPAYLLL